MRNCPVCTSRPGPDDPVDRDALQVHQRHAHIHRRLPRAVRIDPHPRRLPLDHNPVGSRHDVEITRRVRVVSAPATVSTYVPDGTEIVTGVDPAVAFAVSIAARNEQSPAPAVISHTPSPGFTSDPSTNVVTVRMRGASHAVSGNTAPKKVSGNANNAREMRRSTRPGLRHCNRS